MRITKEKKNKVFDFWIIIWLLCNANFLLFSPLYNAFSMVNTYNNKLLIAALSILSFFIYLFQTRVTQFLKIGKLQLLICLLITMVFFMMFFQVIISDESIRGVLSRGYHYFIMLSVFLLLSVYCDVNSCQKLINYSILFGTLFALCNIICFWSLKYYGYRMSSVPLYQNIGNGFRLPQSSDYIGMASVLSASMAMEKERFKKNIYILCFIICLFELYFVAQVRMVMLAVGISFISLMYNKSKNRVLWFVSSLLLVVFLLFDYISDGNIAVITSFIGEGTRYNSIIYRFEEINYYIGYYFHEILFGLGFINDKAILKYSLTDIGILGFLIQFGLIGTVWLVFFILYLKKRFQNSANSVSKGLIIFLTVCFISLNPFDPQRIAFLPLELLLIEKNKYSYSSLNNKIGN